MTKDDFLNFYVPARNTVFEHPSIDKGFLLERLIGSDFYTQWRNDAWQWGAPLTEEVKQQLKMLIGPHGQTIAEAMKAKRGLK